MKVKIIRTITLINHNDSIDDNDVELLNQAGALLSEVDQTKSAEELLETSSAYVEYLGLIDQTSEAEVDDDTDAPEADTEDSTLRSGKFNFINMILNIIKSIIEMIIFIVVPIK